MSLINDVLRDLERRDHPGAPRSLPRAERLPRRQGRWIWWVLAAAVAGVVLHWSLDGTPTGEKPASVPVATTDPAPASRETPAESATPGSKLLPRVATAAETTESGEAAEKNQGGSAAPDPSAPEEPGSRMAATDPGPREASMPESPAGERQAAANDGEMEPAQEPDAGLPDPGAPATPRGRGRPDPPAGPDDGEIVIRRSGGDGPASSEDRLASAKRALGRGQRALAVSQLTKLLDSSPGHVDARLLLARSYIEDGRARAARELLEAGLGNRPGDPALAFLLGRLLLEQGRLSEARRVLTDHAPPVRENPDYHLLLALAHRQGGNHDAAISAYREVTDTSPGVGAAWVGLGVSLEAKGDPEGARAAYREAVTGDDRRSAAFARQRLAVMPASPQAEEH